MFSELPYNYVNNVKITSNKIKESLILQAIMSNNLNFLKIIFYALF